MFYRLYNSNPFALLSFLQGVVANLPEMRLILLIALWLCLSIAVRCDDDREEATVTEELPEGVAEETEEVVYVSPTPNGHIYFAEHFDVPEEFEAKWIRSQAKKEGIDEEIAKYDGKQL